MVGTMPSYEESEKWSIVSYLLYDIKAIKSLLRRISPLFNDERPKLTPMEWWEVEGTYYTHPKVAKAVVVVFQVPIPNVRDFFIKAANFLEQRHNVLLFWAGGTCGRKSYLVIKTRAYALDIEKGLPGRIFRFTKSDLLTIKSGLFKGRAREQERIRIRERVR